MPTYLVHGFRWPRAAIRIHIILFDLEDAAAEWIIAPASAITILNSFYTLYDFLPPSQPPVAPASSNLPPVPTLLEPPTAKGQKQIDGAAGAGPRKGSDGKKRALRFNDWSVVKLLEQYDPDDESNPSQPYAYVADYMVPVTLSLDIGAEMAAYEENQRAEAQPLLSPGIANSPVASSNGTSGTASTGLSEREMKKKSRRLGWFEKLRDQLAKTESSGWYVVVCGDEERTVPDLSGLQIEVRQKGKAEEGNLHPKTPRSGGMRGFFTKKDRRPLGTTDER
jgi:hypothetical protein